MRHSDLVPLKVCSNFDKDALFESGKDCCKGLKLSKRVGSADWFNKVHNF